MRNKCLILTLMLVIIPWLGPRAFAERPRLRGPSSSKRKCEIRYNDHRRHHQHKSRISSVNGRRHHVIRRNKCRSHSLRRQNKRFHTNNNQVNIVIYPVTIEPKPKVQPRTIRKSTHRTIIIEQSLGRRQFRMKTRSEIIAESMKKVGR
jgi:hypothetical protein